MSRSSRAAHRRIMDQLGEENRIPILNIPEGDVGVLFGFPLAGLFIGSTIGIDFLAIGLLLVGLVVGTAVVYAAPANLTAWGWLHDVGRYVLQRPRITHSYRTEAAGPSTEGGPSEYLPFTIEESTQELTGIERAWPGVHAIERTDGSMEAFVELRPGNMDFAMSDQWIAAQEAAEEFANNELQFPLTFHTTTRPFPVEKIVTQLESRLDDADVRDNPVFEELLDAYLDRRPAELRNVNGFHFYLGVEVDRMEIYRQYDLEKTPVEQLAEFPVIGFLFNPFVLQREELEDAQVRNAMFERLDARIETVQTEFVDNMSGFSSRRLTTVELVQLAVEFWNGDGYHDGDGERLMRTDTTLRRQSRRDQS